MVNTGKFFYVGKRYRVRRDFLAGSAFREGEILIFEGDGFNRYDEAHEYDFRCEADGTRKSWMLAEDEPLERREEYFERLPDRPQSPMNQR